MTGWRGPTQQKPYPSLGWDVLEWIYRYLPSPAEADEPFVLTDEQANIILRWYELDPVTEDFTHRRGRLEMAKGWGKSPLAAAIALVEFAGPVRFAKWEHGEPVGQPVHRPVVEIAAVSEDQTDNTYSSLYEMLNANDQKAAKALGIDVGRTRLYLIGRPGMLRPVTASSGSREGARLTFAVLDETHLWSKTNGGVKLAGTLRRNAAKMGGRTFETTNAPVIGEKSVAEASSADPEPGVLHVARRPAIEPNLDWSESDLRAALRHVYGDSYWAPIDRILAEIADPATSWDDALRFYFNVRTAGVARAIDPRLWDEREKPRQLPEGTPIGLGFDGSISRDATVLRGCTTDGYSFLIGAWVRPSGAELQRWLDAHPGYTEWQVIRSEVKEAVTWARTYHRVGRFRYDPPKWYSEGEDWKAEFGQDAEGDWIVQPLDTNQPTKMAPAVDRWRTMLAEGGHTHDGDPVTTAHVKAARLKKVRLADAEDDGRTLYVLIKGEERRQIDGAVADVLALEAAMTMLVPEEPAPFVLAGAKW